RYFSSAPSAYPIRVLYVISCVRSIFLRLSRPRRPTLFPYTTLFRSSLLVVVPIMAAAGFVLQLSLLNFTLDSALAPLLEREVERSEEQTSELQSPDQPVCRLLLEKKTTAVALDSRQRTPTHPLRDCP